MYNTLIQVCEGLFDHYHLPDGRAVHFYCRDGLDECAVEGEIGSAPPLPYTLEGILQQQYPECPPLISSATGIGSLTRYEEILVLIDLDLFVSHTVRFSFGDHECI